MTKQEIKKAIKNGESVWCVYKDTFSIYEIKAVEIEKVLNDTFLWGKEYYANIKDVFKTKAEAEHYLHHKDVSRTETLPFLTWEEFKNGKSVNFVGKYGREYLLKKKYGRILLIWINVNNSIASWDLTEEDFYKAYDEAVRLFREEE